MVVLFRPHGSRGQMIHRNKIVPSRIRGTSTIFNAGGISVDTQLPIRPCNVSGWATRSTSPGSTASVTAAFRGQRSIGKRRTRSYLNDALDCGIVVADIESDRWQLRLASRMLLALGVLSSSCHSFLVFLH